MMVVVGEVNDVYVDVDVVMEWIWWRSKGERKQ